MDNENELVASLKETDNTVSLQNSVTRLEDKLKESQIAINHFMKRAEFYEATVKKLTTYTD